MKAASVKVIATLLCRTIDPELPVGRHVRLYDADALSDDFLSGTTVEPNGAAGCLFDLSASRSLDPLFESKPDLYCVVP